jgi:hypothetical protein
MVRHSLVGYEELKRERGYDGFLLGVFIKAN